MDEMRDARNRAASLEAGIARLDDSGDDGTPLYVGIVYSGGSMPSAPSRYYLTHPVRLSGDEAEGAAGTVAADASISVPVAVFDRVPAVGDILLATYHEPKGRWVARRRAAAAGGTYPTSAIADCFCTSFPDVIHMTADTTGGACVGTIAGPGFTFITYPLFHTGTISHQLSPGEFEPFGPPFYSLAGVQQSIWLGDQFWTDPGLEDYPYRYILGCSLNLITLGKVYLQYPGTRPDGTIGPNGPARGGLEYSWVINGTTNSCSPFLMTIGSIVFSPRSALSCIILSG